MQRAAPTRLDRLPTPAPRIRARPRPRRSGFTLLETALATVIIGVGVLALIEAQQTFMKANDWSTHAATATYLANEIRERMRDLPKHDPVTGLYLQDDGGSTTLVGWGPDAGELGVEDFDDVDDFDGLFSTGLLFSWDGTPGLDDNDLRGPIDATNVIIPEIDNEGVVVTDPGSGGPMPLRGWSQHVRVEKVNPFNYGELEPDDEVIPPEPPDILGVPIDEFPLRVTVTVRYQGLYDAEPTDVATVVWIVP